ncbi:hypothetical protein Tcan_03211 [Toxocara canis]|uniref:Uncharacterized protein n=1 Tax=Toxocara canis TaxID=6265 RepID=A0A0B2W1M2_TOXCA|nr:hypothetical protein Tcan_03211 [Toxocara canis]
MSKEWSHVILAAGAEEFGGAEEDEGEWLAKQISSVRLRSVSCAPPIPCKNTVRQETNDLP